MRGPRSLGHGVVANEVYLKIEIRKFHQNPTSNGLWGLVEKQVWKFALFSLDFVEIFEISTFESLFLVLGLVSNFA